MLSFSRINFLGLAFVVLFLASTNRVEGQDEKSDVKTQEKAEALIKSLGDSSCRTRAQASKDLLDIGSDAIEPLFAAINDGKSSAEVRKNCRLILKKMANSDDDGLKSSIKKFLADHDPAKYPTAKSVLLELREVLLFETRLSEENAIGVLKSCRCDVFPKNDFVIIDLSRNFVGDEQDLKSIFAFKKPLRITVNAKLPPELFELISNANVSHLTFEHSNKRMSNDDFEKAMKWIAQIDSLESLIFSGSFPLEPLRHIGKLSKLKSLDLPDNLTNESLEFLSELSNLTSLELSGYYLDVGEILSQLKCKSTLTRLNLYGARIFPPDDYPILEKFAALTELTLNQNCTDSILKSVAKLKNLETLTLNNTLITDSGFQYLMKHPALKTCNISETPISDDSMSVLDSLPKLNRVEIELVPITKLGFESLKCAEKAYKRTGIGTGLFTDGSFASKNKSFFMDCNEEDYLNLKKMIKHGVTIRPSWRQDDIDKLIVVFDIRQVNLPKNLTRSCKSLLVSDLIIGMNLEPFVVEELCTWDKSIRVEIGELSDENAEKILEHFENVKDFRKK